MTNTSVVAHVQQFRWRSIYVKLIGLKNDYDGVMGGPYLSRGDKGYRTP